MNTKEDYGSDPIGDGMFKMTPSGDVVDLEERNKRCSRDKRPEMKNDCLGLSWNEIERIQGGKLNRDNVTNKREINKMNTKELSTVVIFDNGGGTTLQLGGYAHYYEDAEDAAEDWCIYQSGADTSDWDGHEDYSAALDPTEDEISNGGYLVMDTSDVEADVEAPNQTSWANRDDFIAGVMISNRNNEFNNNQGETRHELKR